MNKIELLIEKYANNSNNKEGNIINLIRRDCKPFLKEFKDFPIFRGIESSEDFIIKTPRIDRKPTDMPLWFHNVVDKAFNDIFGWKARSEGVFCSNDIEQATQYGSNVYYFFPVGDYRYVYSDTIKDLYVYASKHDYIADGWHEYKYEHKAVTDSDKEKLYNFIKSKYTDKGFRTNKQDHTEVIFKCDRYYALDTQSLMKYEVLPELGYKL